MKGLHMIAFALLVIGGLNWGLVALGDWNVVNMLLGSVPTIERIVYVLVGVSAIFELVTHKQRCRECKP